MSITTALSRLPTGDARESVLRLVADSVPALIAYYEVGTLVCTFANRQYAEYNGWTVDTALGKTVREIIGEAAYGVIGKYVEAAVQGKGSHYSREQTLPDGSKRMIEVNLIPHLDGLGNPHGCVVLINDITDHWEVETALRHSEERMRLFSQVTREGVLVHRNFVITDVNDAALRISGFAREEILGRRTLDFMPAVWHDKVRAILASDSDQAYEVSFIHRDGHEVPVECAARTVPFEGETLRLVIMRDITEQRRAQARIEFLALHDPLTQLPNRAHLVQRLGEVLSIAKRHGRAMAVLFIDLDNFKTVNDSLGHHAGDVLLREVAQRITSTVRDSDVVSRLGGDEFVVVLSEIASSQDAALVAQKLLEAVNAPVSVGETQLNVSPSIGISLFPRDGETTDELIRHADSAMYHAKDSGRGNFKFFQPELFERATGALDLERQLRAALFNQEFILHFQPQQRGVDGAVVGMEALLRWRHPNRGLVGPAEFISFAEMRGLVVALDRWVLRSACRQMKAWHDQGCPRVPVAVNLSAVDFRQDDLLEEVQGVLLETGLAPQHLEIEITESVFMDRAGHVMETLVALSKMGVAITLDDFGTGYSSLAYLKRYPISKLKIDQSFIRDLPRDADDLALVTAIIQMAHGLKLRTVAEGVETPDQLAQLRQLGCDEFQGYLIARPLPAEQARAFLVS